MLNHIWAFLIVVGVIVGFGTAIKNAAVGEAVITKSADGKEVKEFKKYETAADKAKAFSAVGTKITKDAFNSVSFSYTDAAGNEKSGAVGIAINFIGMMALWLGIMKVAEVSGMINALARIIAPLFRIIFPSIPKDHPASGAILMNFAANMLGLDNAATPLGIKAMKELQELNGKKDTASNAMCMFLCLNVSSLTLIPASIIGYRVAAKSDNPTAFWVPMLIATSIGTLTAFFLCKLYERVSADTPRETTIVEEQE